MIKKLMFLFLSVFMSVCFANTAVTKNAAEVKKEFVEQITKDGYLSEKMASEIKAKYIKEENLKVAVSVVAKDTESKNVASSFYDKYVNIMNAIKVVGVCFLLFATWGVIRNIITGIWNIITIVPAIVYQIIALSIGMCGLLYPELIWQSQSFYVALFSSFFVLFCFPWFAHCYPKVAEKFLSLFKLGIPVESVLSFWLMLYFGALANHYHSSVFGFFTAVALSGVFSFGIKYYPGVLMLYFKESALPAVIFGHLIVLIGYVGLNQSGVISTQYYDIGIQYYCTIALCVGLLVGSSPFARIGEAMSYSIIFTILCALSFYGYFVLDYKVISSIIMCFYILFLLEWIGYVGFTIGLITGSALVGAALYGGVMLFEHYGQMIVLKM